MQRKIQIYLTQIRYLIFIIDFFFQFLSKYCYKYNIEKKLRTTKANYYIIYYLLRDKEHY